MTLIKIDHTEYGLDEKKAQQISDMFKPMLDRMTALEVQFNEVVSREIEPETIQMAHDLRLAYVKVRTGTDAIHKQLKAFYLNGGRFVDGWRNAQRMASQGNEEKLKAIEDHFVNLEKEKVAKLQHERSQALDPYTEFIPPQLGEMAEDVWENYLFGVKAAHEQRIADQEAQRIAEEKKRKDEELRQARIRKQNYKLRLEAKEREAAQAEERRIQEEKLAKERAAREKIEQELRAKEEAEQRAREEEKARLEAERKKGDKDKAHTMMDELLVVVHKYDGSFKSKKYQELHAWIWNMISQLGPKIEA